MSNYDNNVVVSSNSCPARWSFSFYTGTSALIIFPTFRERRNNVQLWQQSSCLVDPRWRNWTRATFLLRKTREEESQSVYHHCKGRGWLMPLSCVHFFSVVSSIHRCCSAKIWTQQRLAGGGRGFRISKFVWHRVDTVARQGLLGRSSPMFVDFVS